MATESSSTPEGHPPRRLLRSLLWSGAAVLAAVTVYLATVAVLWGIHVHDLRAATNDLSDELSDTAATLAETNVRLGEAEHNLKVVLDDITNSANEKARSEDYQLLFLDVANYMSECADAADELVDYVYDRDHYYAWQLRERENLIREYYSELTAAFNDLVNEMEQAI